ncbi:MAG: hypothetical protein H7Y86_13145 [Rhizobacter sp.]|nr:hypothetical protein [Ferruginibacter sp.]
MKKLQKDILPVSQRSQAAYLGVSHSLLSMTSSGRSGRTLGTVASAKLLALIQAHLQPVKPGNGPAFKKLQKDLDINGNKLAKKMLREADYSNMKALRLQNRLDSMKEKYREDTSWLQTIELMMSDLPTGRVSSGDRTWLAYQQAITTERLKRNSITAQAEMLLAIEMEKAKERVYREVREELIEKMG